jgi:hypothetical protein
VNDFFFVPPPRSGSSNCIEIKILVTSPSKSGGPQQKEYPTSRIRHVDSGTSEIDTGTVKLEDMFSVDGSARVSLSSHQTNFSLMKDGSEKSISVVSPSTDEIRRNKPESLSSVSVLLCFG